MEIGTVLLIIWNLILLVVIAIVWKKAHRRPQDDPRLSRGLQLLQSKISVLEDLSDRTDTQVKQLISLIETKTRQIQSKIFESEKQVQRIEQSMHKSLEVADIFQDKIPHEEIIERQNTVKYVQAAQLAHQGRKVEEIVKMVGLPKGEVEFIVKVNRDELVFDKDNLPAWAQKKSEDFFEENSDASKYSVEKVFGASLGGPNSIPETGVENLKKLDNEFKQACKAYEAAEQKFEQPIIDFAPTVEKAKEWTKIAVDQSSKVIEQTADVLVDAAHKITEKSKEIINVDLDSGELKSESVKGVEPVREMSVTEILDSAKSVVDSKGASTKPSKKKLREEPVIRKVIFPRVDKDGFEL